MLYDPPRQSHPQPPKDPLEIQLVFNVRPCGTCAFFWPQNTAEQPYGPYSSYDFNSNTPAEKAPESDQNSFLWIEGVTRPPSFPDAEVMDGCRKAPIMTIGINPNLTAFGPGKTGASWCYPSLSSDHQTDAWTKYAYYYRYRSVYQEHFDLKFAEQFLLPDGRVKAAKAGVVQEYTRLSDDPAFEIRVLYDGDSSPTAIHIPGKLGQAPYVVIVDAGQRFAEGDLLAAQISIPAAQKVDVYDQPITYYTQMLPVLAKFEAYLKKKGHADAKLQVGEDVGQLDMVACASPHWGTQWLGGTSQSVNDVVANCVHKNAWAIKQLVQTQPAVLLLVGQASWNMFWHSFGHLVSAPQPLPAIPEDGPYTLLRQTSGQDCRIVFSTTVDGQKYSLSTRLIIAPDFSYNENYVPQFRMAPAQFTEFAKNFPQAAEFLQHDPRIKFQKPVTGYIAAGLVKDATAVLTEIKQKFAPASAQLRAAYYDPHQILSNVLSQLYDQGELTYTASRDGKPGFLSRNSGPCTFCDNQRWRFPKGCPYGKPGETQYPIGFLEKVAQVMAAQAV
jgi:hypothetical protein